MHTIHLGDDPDSPDRLRLFALANGDLSGIIYLTSAPKPGQEFSTTMMSLRIAVTKEQLLKLLAYPEKDREQQGAPLMGDSTYYLREALGAKRQGMWDIASLNMQLALFMQQQEREYVEDERWRLSAGS